MTEFERETIENWAYPSALPSAKSNHTDFPDKKLKNENVKEFVFHFEDLGFESVNLYIKKIVNNDYLITVRENFR